MNNTPKPLYGMAIKIENETYIFSFDKGEELWMASCLIQLARDSTVKFDWMHLAFIAHQLGGRILPIIRDYFNNALPKGRSL